MTLISPSLAAHTCTCMSLLLLSSVVTVESARVKSRQTAIGLNRTETTKDYPLSVLVYNVEYKISSIHKKGQEEPLNNVMSYLAKESPSFTLVLEASRTFLTNMCKSDDAATSKASDGAVRGELKESGKPCAYIYDQSMYEGIAIMFEPDTFKLKQRTCINYGETAPVKGWDDVVKDQPTHPSRDEIHSGAAKLENCVDLGKGEDFTHLEKFDSDGFRTLLMAQFEDTRSGTNFVMVTCHPDHDYHQEDLGRLAKALQKFYDASKPDEKPDFIIFAGDFNTQFNGITPTFEQQLDWLVENKKKDTGKPKYGDRDGKKAVAAVQEKTWTLDDPDKRANSINHVLATFLEGKYSKFKDAAGEGNAAEGTPSAAKPDERTCCEYNKLKKEKDKATGKTTGKLIFPEGPEKLKFAYDHILFADSVKAPVKSYAVTLGHPSWPASDHIPMKLDYEYTVNK